jgi:hypothetical protein
MIQKSLVYVVLAVAVGYILVSAVPQQVAMYTAPQQMLSRGDGELTIESTPESGSDSLAVPELSPDNSLGSADEVREVSFIEMTRLPELMKWWTLDVLVALTIYWVAKRRLV